MSRLLEKLCIISVLTLLAIVYLRELLNLAFLGNMEVIFLIMVILTCLVLAKGASFYVSLVSLIIGHFLIFKYNMDYGVWLEGITKNLPLAIVFLMVPVLSIPLKEGGYLETVNCLVGRNVNKPGKLFFALSGSVMGFSSIANLGGIPVIHDLVQDVKLPRRFLSRVYAAGFASCIPWSPYFASVNLVLYYTGVPFNRYFLVGFINGLLFLLLASLLFFLDKDCQNEMRTNTQKKPEPENIKRKFFFLILNIIGLFLALIIGEKIIKFSSMMFLVGIIAFLYAAIWSFAINKFNNFIFQMKNYDQTILQVKNEVVFFISVGFLGVILANTPIQEIIEIFFKGISGYSTFILVEVVIILTALLSALGIHHVITITALGLSVSASVLGLTDMAYAITLIAAYTVAMLISPFSPFNIINGSLLKKNSFVVSLRWNSPFAILIAFVSGFVVSLVNYF